MGGKGSGGSRVGAGRKPNDANLRAIQGNPGHRGAVAQGPWQPAATAPLETFEPSAVVKDNEKVLAIWNELAPHAFEARTLTRATEHSFVMLCHNVALMWKLAKGRKAGGADHRNLIQRVDTEMAKFCLAPLGKPIYAAKPDAPASKLDRFTQKGARR